MLFTFPSRYLYAIGLTGVFSLAGWTRPIRAGLHVSRATQDTTRLQQASSTELSSSPVELSRTFLSPSACHSVVLLPRRRVKRRRFGLIPGRSPLLGESLLFSSPGGTKMFQFPPFASRASARDDSPSGCRVVPFGNPRVKGHLHLTAAYRSLSRPSSPP